MIDGTFNQAHDFVIIGCSIVYVATPVLFGVNCYTKALTGFDSSQGVGEHLVLGGTLLFLILLL